MLQEKAGMEVGPATTMRMGVQVGRRRWQMGLKAEVEVEAEVGAEAEAAAAAEVPDLAEEPRDVGKLRSGLQRQTRKLRPQAPQKGQKEGQ